MAQIFDWSGVEKKKKNPASSEIYLSGLQVQKASNNFFKKPSSLLTEIVGTLMVSTIIKIWFGSCGSEF